MGNEREHPHEDLTGRARVRDAALEVFAEHGAKGATVQAIASAAGVSTGLIRHHFGSKDGLRAACDEYAIGALLEQARRSLGEDVTAPGFATAMYQASEVSTRYLARALVEGTQAAADLFDTGAELTERFLSEHWPDRYSPGTQLTRDTAAAMGAMHLGTLVLHAHLSRRMGADTLSKEHAPRVGSAMLGVYSAMGDFFSGEQGKRITASLADSTVPPDGNPPAEGTAPLGETTPEENAASPTTRKAAQEENHE